jgi:formylglycine-generating enzyme required for sulfatase activity
MIRSLNQHSILFLLLVSFSFTAFANNLQISNVSLAGQNIASGYTTVRFDISWENSWRLSTAPNNWDAAWIFVKYRPFGGEWQHATLNYVDGSPANDGHFAPAGSTLSTPSDGKGSFLYRDATGTGTVNWTGVQLRWNYAADGVGHNDLLDIKVVGIEMAYVNEGAYDLGSGGGGIGEFHQFPDTSMSYPVTSAAAIPVGAVAGYLFYPNELWSGDQNGPIPSSFPNGFTAFYCMKYEISEGQWVDFINSLAPSQKTDRDITGNHPVFKGKNSDVVVKRNAVVFFGGQASTTSPELACSFLAWSDGIAYADWAGLRPMTELEYEKASRGPDPSIPNSFCWGTGNRYNVDYVLSNPNTADEMVTNPGVGKGNAAYAKTTGIIDGPVRVGIFAASAITKNREETGATYYGIMEMSGNLLERCVTPGRPQGRAFTHTHGDGVLTSSGAANVPTWPADDGTGGGFRGGRWFFGISDLWISDRHNATTPSPERNSANGFRCVRTAP